ncbi:MAG: IS701 family transposase [Mycobacterium sp.]
MSSGSAGRRVHPQSQPGRSALSRSRTREGAGACLPVGTPAPQQPRIATPASLTGLLGEFGCCFTAPTFATFCALACGFLAQSGRRTVCGMLVGARLSRVWSHHRAHRFFSAARWSVSAVSAVLARLIVTLLVEDGEPVTIAIDDTLFHRRGPKVHAVSWFHDGSAAGARKIGYGNNWVIAAIVVRLPFLDRPLALPAGFALVCKGVDDSRLVLARRLVEQLATTLPGRVIDVVADSAYAGRSLRGLPATITWTTRLRSNAALYDLAPPRTGRRGRPRLKGQRLPALAQLADSAVFTATRVHRYGHTTTVQTSVRRCLWYGVLGPQQVQVVIVRDRDTTSGYGIALVSTDLSASPAQIIERYAARWSIEVAIEDAKQITGVGQARNRLPAAVARTVPFELVISSLAICWYALAGHQPDDVTAARQLAPWYRSKTQPSVADMIAKLRRVIIATQFQREHPEPATPREISILRLAWANAAA